MKQLLRIFTFLLTLVLVAGLFLCMGLVFRSPVRQLYSQLSHQPEVAEPTETLATSAPETEPPTTEPLPTETEPPMPEEFLLTFAGDCTLGATERHSYIGYGFHKVVGDNYAYPFENVIDYFGNDEMTFVNLEGPLSDESHPAAKRYVFRGPTEFVNILTEGSVEAVSLANNHSLDHGQFGYDSTRSVLDAAGIGYAEQDVATVLTSKNGLTIGIYGAVYYELDTEAILAGIQELRQSCDLVIFAPHWGSEHSFRQNKTQTELAHAAIDAGADFVWASHPHVLQPIEEYNGRYICYSLANFSFGGNIYPGDYDTALVQLKVTRQPDGTVSTGELIVVPCNVSSTPKRNDFRPTPYEEGSEEYLRTMSKLDGTYHLASLPVS